MDIPIKQTDDAKGRAAKVRLVIFDVDGVLTSGKIAIGNFSEHTFVLAQNASGRMTV